MAQVGIRFEGSRSLRRLIAGCLAFAALPTAQAPATPFVHETVVSSGNVGEYPSLEIDSRGNSRISYFASSTLDLRYTFESGGVWTTEAVDTAGTVGLYTSLEIAPDGTPSISYYSVLNTDLKYASRSTGSWSVETVDGTDSAGSPSSSLSFDALGRPHISYYTLPGADLKYAVKDGGIWTLETVDAASAVGVWNSMVVDPWGRPHIAYNDASATNLKYAVKEPALGWVPEVVDGAATSVGEYASLALDQEGAPHIAYYNASTGDLNYAFKTGLVWTVETVDSVGVVGKMCALTLDSERVARIAYYDDTTNDIKLATRIGSTWITERVDPSVNLDGVTGRHISIDLDGHGNPRVAHWYAFGSDLKLADSSVRLRSPLGGETWPVGALRTVSWSGIGPVSIYLSADGGGERVELANGIFGNVVSLRVPHVPTRFAQLEVVREEPRSESSSDSLFSIESSIELLGFSAASAAGRAGEVELAWSTNPGAEDLLGYTLERRLPGRARDSWERVVTRTTASMFVDVHGSPGAVYRLTAINGHGQEYVIGETSTAGSTPLSAWPLPLRGGDLEISFETASGLGGRPGRASVEVYDVTGRRVRNLVNAELPAGTHRAQWDGRDSIGRPVSNGIYFVRTSSAGVSQQMKVVVMR
jgi:hypothetical protein